MDTTYVEEIARQLHHTKPDHLVPGQHVGMEQLATYTLRVIVRAPGQTPRQAEITYQPGADHYDVEIVEQHPWPQPWTASEHTGVYCDQLGELVFGADAKPFTMPTVVVTDWPA